MSFRLLTIRLHKHGRLLLQNYLKRDIHNSILDSGGSRRIAGEFKAGDTQNQYGLHRLRETQENLRTKGLLRLGSQARRLFVDNVLNRVTNPYSAELRAQATKRLMFGDSTPFLALVGISLASGDSMLTKDDEIEAVCREIRGTVTRLQNKIIEQKTEKRVYNELCLENLKIGPPLAKGCSAVVYAAAFKNELKPTTTLVCERLEEATDFLTDTRHLSTRSLNIDCYNHSFGSSMENMPFSNTDACKIDPNTYTLLQLNPQESALDNEHQDKRSKLKKKRIRFDSAELSNRKSRLLSDAIDGYAYQQSMQRDFETILIDHNINVSVEQYPLALKMMFNYDIQSNAMSILKAMYKETVPAKTRNVIETENWERQLLDQTIFLPPHPNVVEMYGVFCAQVPELRMSSSLYPMALPPRINPQGYGRNMSLFLLMKRYSCSLQNYLNQTSKIDIRTRILLFSQLLEAVAHINRYEVAHRDMKSDNILIEVRPDMPPILVLSDFGCCVADKTNGLQIPYKSGDVDIGGNTALMAPEIINKQPGTFSVLNYSKSDLWACGAIAYEIFGSSNPFYGSKNNPNTLKNTNYKKSDLPQLTDEVPILVRKLVENLLSRNVSERLSPDIAANVMQLLLWSPSSWTKNNFSPSSNEILQWLLSLTTKVLCEGSIQVGNQTMGRRTYTEYLLITSFLVRARIRSIKRALDWIHNIDV
ncbi:serine/threonine-protein kinase Pink1, mitochondrial isoform X2 [Malaya genurostris]|uniref:serine/threonine-protein kinase Pink1, mitochondrial isoform X2 n=1 Tax=Malaya genurostris TaxID=325434 RepID=UPI0026F3E7B3|nr:serine/threonine-protein kinase Pink1, mitochondrial isoform X2 [Malaya genurostris]